MKKTNFLKILMTLVMAFVITGAFAQPFEDANYTETNGTDMYQTVGKSFGLYVIPDPAYSPLYTGAGTIGAGVQWTWTFPAGLGAAEDASATAITTGTAQGSNYIEFTNPATTGGPYTVGAVESNTGAACVGPAQNQDVYIIAAPTAALTAAPADGDWQEITANFEYQRCTEMPAGDDITVTFTETGVPAAMANYAYGVQLVRTAYDTDGVTVVDGPTTSTVINYDTDAKVAGGAVDGGSVTEACGALTYYNDGTDDYRTKYEFTLIKASDAPGAALDGVISQISHKSDYIDGTVTTYAFAGNTVTYWINLPPVTGPIYHIPNNYTF
jgi:hypothetical protein